MNSFDIVDTNLIPTRGGSIVRVVTEGDGAPVLAIHGLGGGSYFFEGCARRLAERYQVAAVDLPGTGASTTSVVPSMSVWVADLADVIEARCGQPCVIVGHSLGTIVALELWRARPELVRAMVFVGGLPKPRPVVCERLRARAEAIRRDGMAGWGLQVASGVFAAASRARLPETVALFARLFDAQPVESYLRCLEILIGADVSDVPKSVAVPCASISGQDDQYAPPDDVTLFVRELPAGTPQLLMPDVGHLPFFEAPDAFAVALGDVLLALTGPRG